MNAWDQALFLSINAGADTPAWAVLAGRLVASRLIWLLPLMLGGLWLWGDPRRRKTLVRTVAVTILALGINQGIGFLWPVERPFVAGIGHQWLAHAPTFSFPSNHLTVLFASALCLWRDRLPWLGPLIMGCAVLVAWARIFVGVHYPLDMLGALATAALAWLVTARWFPR